MGKEQYAKEIYEKVKRMQLDNFRKSMPENKQGVEFTCNGIKYIAAIRRLTPTECDKLQTIPSWYNWADISDSQRYKMLGNGWTVDVIKHCFSFLPKFNRPIRVWSLFDGMACGYIALKELDIEIESYVSSEIDKHAIKAEKQNVENIIQVGSVTDIDVDDLVQQYGVPDFLFGGSPCQSFSFSGKMQGMSTAQGEEIYTLERYLEFKSKGFKFDGQSYLFWEYMRILTELRKYNTNIYFFLENVEMLEKWEKCLSHAIGVRGCHINSALVSAQGRRRIYWSNIKTKRIPDTRLFPEEDANNPFAPPYIQTDFPQPEDRGINIGDVIEETASDKYYLNDSLVKKLMEHVNQKKLRDFVLEPQVSKDEILEYLSDDESLTSEEKRKIADIAYKLEEQRLKDLYYGQEDEVW